MMRGWLEVQVWVAALCIAARAPYNNNRDDMLELWARRAPGRQATARA